MNPPRQEGNYNVYDVHDGGESEARMAERRPLIYDPRNKNLFVGKLGGFHNGILEDFPMLQRLNVLSFGSANPESRDGVFLRWHGEAPDEASDIHDIMAKYYRHPIPPYVPHPSQAMEEFPSWKLSNNQEIQFYETRPPTQQEENDPLFGNRRPFIYNPLTSVLTMGPWGSHHTDIFRKNHAPTDPQGMIFSGPSDFLPGVGSIAWWFEPELEHKLKVESFLRKKFPKETGWSESDPDPHPQLPSDDFPSFPSGTFASFDVTQPEARWTW